METYVLNDIKLKRQNCVKDIRNYIKLYLKVFDEPKVHELTLNHSSFEVTTKPYGSAELTTPPTVMPFSANQKSRTNSSRLDIKHTLMNTSQLRLEAYLSSCSRTRTIIAAQERP